MPADVQQQDAKSADNGPSAPSEADAENWWDFCPNCGARLHNRGCKFRCPDCFYFMSCSDFDQ